MAIWLGFLVEFTTPLCAKADADIQAKASEATRVKRIAFDIRCDLLNAAGEKKQCTGWRFSSVEAELLSLFATQMFVLNFCSRAC